MNLSISFAHWLKTIVSGEFRLCKYFISLSEFIVEGTRTQMSSQRLG